MDNYKFNKEKLKFEEEKRGILWWVGKVGKYLLLTLLLALCYYAVISLIFSTDEQRRLERENKAMAKEFDFLEERLEILDNTVSNLLLKDREIYKMAFNSEPPAFSLTSGGGLSSGDIKNDRNEELAASTYLSLLSTRHEANEANRSIEQIYESMDYLKGDLSHIPTIVPLRDFRVSQAGASVGKKVNPFYKTVVMHNGMDLIASVGAEVVASADGTVSLTIRSSRERGNSIEIDHGNGYKTIYSHLGDILVRKGMEIKRGETIARVGNSGMSFAPHLHYSIYLREKEVDPLNYFFASLSMEQYKNMLLISSNTGQSLD